MASQVPLGRIGSVDEIAKPALFLASSDSAFVTGVELAVDGAWRRSDAKKETQDGHRQVVR